MNQSDFSWELLRDVLSLARSGGVRRAATARGQSHATLSRHLTELESLLGTPVVVRVGRGVELTEVGQDLALAAERVESEVHALLRRVADREVEISGVVRLTLLSTLVLPIAPVLAQLRKDWPELCVEISVGLGLSNLTRREADIAIRIQEQPEEHLVGSRVGALSRSVYKARGLALPQDPHDWPWINWDDELRHCESALWLERTFPTVRPIARVADPQAMLQLIRAGVGVGMLFDLSAEPYPELEPCLEMKTPPTAMWILTHPDLRRVPRVNLVMRLLSEHLRGLVAHEPPSVG